MYCRILVHFYYTVIIFSLGDLNCAFNKKIRQCIYSFSWVNKYLKRPSFLKTMFWICSLNANTQFSR